MRMLPLPQSVKERLRLRKYRKWYYSVFVALASIVVFCTVYALILPAITMEKKQEILDCPLHVHQHTAECYGENETLICGQADFVIHTHNERCYNEAGELMCLLPEKTAHEHTDECYKEEESVLICDTQEHSHSDDCYQPEKILTCKETAASHMHTDECYKEEPVLICDIQEHTHSDECYQAEKTTVCTETAVLHTHDEPCYDENGSLICGKLQVTEHVHENACFHTEENTQEPLSEDGVLPAENDIMTTADTGENVTWGYDENGSIWWSAGSQFNQISEIQENTPYIFMGYRENNLMGDETFEKNGSSYLKAIPKETVSDYTAYQRWYFEKAEGDKSYYIYYLAADNTKTYLQFAGAGAPEWGKTPQKVMLTPQKAQATIFTVERVGDMSAIPDSMTKYPNHIAISAVIDTETYYINSYYGDRPGNDNLTKHWWGYPEASEGSALKICRYEPSKKTANRIETASSPNTVINLFDYWLSDDPAHQFSPDNKTADMNAGINKDHAFKFVRNNESKESMNIWTGDGINPRQGIVSNTLNSDGYPVLSGDTTVNGNASTESLAYLFDPSVEHAGKVSYRNVGGLLSINDQGYYAYDCKTYAAEFDKKNNRFNVYDKPAVRGEFFPINQVPEIMEAGRDDAKVNHYFGVTITNRFVQQNGGHTDETRKTETTFHFSGDDDVWIFIDGVLVGDVGGIHDRASVTINFATGNVEVQVINGKASQPILQTTLKECYENAYKSDVTEWNTDGTTYKDGTTHTLKFFYLERGNYNSNMELKYNLTEIPKTAIYKVDQYGETVPGATFAVYAADTDYNMLNKKNGEKVILPEAYTYNEDGDIVDENQQILASALYIGTTNQKGEMLFADPDGMPYAINEMKDMFGTNFILREIKVPEGYRVVSEDVHLQIWQGESQKILKCDNTTYSGSRAASTLQITATDTLHLQKPYNGENTVEYYKPDKSTFGTLFAVVFRYTGEIDENGNALGSINDDKDWVPVYGSDKQGYSLIDTSGGLAKAALAAAVKAQEYGDVIFSLSSSGTMQLTLENLPGHITSYYRMLSQDQKQKAQYTVGYYWTPAERLEDATPETIYRVSTFAETSADGIHYSGFERVFGANIQVPNLINKVFVQKVDENNKQIDGATFAIYPVNQLNNGTIQYRLDDGSYIPLSENASVADNGVISDGSHTINPMQTDTTRTYEDGIHIGTSEFDNLPDGQYIIKEVKAPPGYSLNTADVMVLVTEDTIYANAGTEDDGITVGRGPGYLVTSLSQFAAEDQIDNTLTWIYAQMQISEDSTLFSDAENLAKIKGYLKNNYTAETTLDPSEAFRTNLKYAAGNEGTAFNYVPNTEHPGLNQSTGSGNTDLYRRLFTTSGWPHYEIYQDYDYGIPLAKQNNANYEDWSGQNLANLFSRSTYIRVLDEQKTDIKIKKVDISNQTLGLSGAQFRMYQTQPRGDGTEAVLYYRWDPETKTAQWTEDAKQALTITTGDDGLSDPLFSGLKDGTYFLEEIRAPDGYYKQDLPIQLTITQAKLTVESHTDIVVQEVLDEKTNLYTYTLVVPNKGGYKLPETGGNGTIGYTFGGILLMGIPLVYGYKKKRKRERRIE